MTNLPFYYNTQQPDLILKEYGRNIHKLVDQIVIIEDREERTRMAYSLIELMRQINPNTRDSQDYQNKLWDDLFIMSHFKLDVDSPYPMPEVSSLGKKPQKVNYNNNRLKYKHYGRNVELLLEKADKLQDSEDRYYAFVQIGRLMKIFYITWNKDNIPDGLIYAHINEILGKKLDEEIVNRMKAENSLDLSAKERSALKEPALPTGGNDNAAARKRKKKKKKK